MSAARQQLACSGVSDRAPARERPAAAQAASGVAGERREGRSLAGIGGGEL